MIITGLSLASFVYLFVSSGFENINGELIEAAQVAGSSRAGVFFKVVLPLLRPSLVYGGGVALLLGLGQFTAPLLLGRNSGCQRADDGHVLRDDQHAARLRASRPRSGRPCSYSASSCSGVNRCCSVTRRGS